MSARRAAARLSVVVEMPNRDSSSCVRCLCGSLAVTEAASTRWLFRRPPIIASPIAPAPMNASDAPFSGLLCTGLSCSLNDPLIGGQLLEPEGPPGVKLLSGDAHLCAEAEFSAIGELRAGV